MPRPAPLIARLRRRLSTSVWVFALLVLGKLATASLCQMDGLADAVASSADRTEIVAAAAAPVHDDAFDAGDSCWHSGAGGCHCSCAHGVALPAMTADSAATVSLHLPPTLHVADFPAAPRRTTLRPPIA